MAFDEQIFAVQRHGGISRVFAELAHQFVSDPTLGVELQPVAAPLVNEYVLRNEDTRTQLVIRPARHWSTSLARSMVRRRHRGPADIVHNTFYLPRALTDYPQAKRVVTVHDMTPETFPETRRRLDFLTVKKRYVDEADHIVCVSESTKRNLIQIYGIPDAPISVVPSGVGTEFSPHAPRLPGWPDRYLLFVGHRGSYKDAGVLFRAFQHVVTFTPNVQLALVGGGPITRRERAYLQSLGILEKVFQSSIPDERMPNVYANSQLFIFPSRSEGFGLPALEAMASGVPVVLCDSGALPEVGGQAAAYFRPGDEVDLTRQIIELIEDEQQWQNLRHAGLLRAQGFTWKNTASRMASVYQATIGR